MNGLSCWMYVSTAAISCAEAEQVVDEIVRLSRSRNAALAVTGALIFSGDSFAQVIEGPTDAIVEMRAAISRDTRHCEILTVADNRQRERDFADWSLAYSGTALFVARELDRIRVAHNKDSPRSRSDLKRLLTEFALG